MPAIERIQACVPAFSGFGEDAGEALLHARFRHWRGRSGRLYVFSVYSPAECPPYENAVLAVAARRGDVLLCVDMGALPQARLSELRRLFEDRLDEVEFQIHVLTDRAPERLALIEDLRPLAA